MSYTSKDAANILRVSRVTINLHCRKLGLKKHGPAWLIDNEGLERLRASVHGKVGNPNWRKDDY
jgi:hypothetical protein